MERGLGTTQSRLTRLPSVKDLTSQAHSMLMAMHFCGGAGKGRWTEAECESGHSPFLSRTPGMVKIIDRAVEKAIEGAAGL